MAVDESSSTWASITVDGSAPFDSGRRQALTSLCMVAMSLILNVSL